MQKEKTRDLVSTLLRPSLHIQMYKSTKVIITHKNSNTIILGANPQGDLKWNYIVQNGHYSISVLVNYPIPMGDTPSLSTQRALEEWWTHALSTKRLELIFMSCILFYYYHLEIQHLQCWPLVSKTSPRGWTEIAIESVKLSQAKTTCAKISNQAPTRHLTL